MGKSTVRRCVVTAIAGPALLLAAPAVAMADEASFQESTVSAGPDGASFENVNANATAENGTGAGTATFQQSSGSANAEGVTLHSVNSSVNAGAAEEEEAGAEEEEAGAEEEEAGAEE